MIVQRQRISIGKALAALLLVVIAASLRPAFADEAAQPVISKMEKLGKLLFEDPALSQPNGTSCSSCHVKAFAFTGNNNSSIPAIALGSRADQFGRRKVPTLMYAAFSPVFHLSAESSGGGVIKLTAKGGKFWDGRADGFTDQARGPLFNPVEMNNADEKSLAESLRNSSSAPAMREVFGDQVFDDPANAVNSLALALSAYEAGDEFWPFSSKFDRFLEGKARLSAKEALGFRLFKDRKKGNCLSCHAGKEGSRNPKDWLFTDFSYRALGLPRNPSIPANADSSTYDLGLCKRPGIEKLIPASADVEELCGAFKVPTLRDVTLRKTYFHNGIFTDLSAAIRFYATRDTDPAKWYPSGTDGKVDKLNDLSAAFRKNVSTGEVPYDRKPGEKPHLTENEIDAIAAFLATLTDEGLGKP